MGTFKVVAFLVLIAYVCFVVKMVRNLPDAATQAAIREQRRVKAERRRTRKRLKRETALAERRRLRDARRADAEAWAEEKYDL